MQFRLQSIHSKKNTTHNLHRLLSSWIFHKIFHILCNKYCQHAIPCRMSANSRINYTVNNLNNILIERQRNKYIYFSQRKHLTDSAGVEILNWIAGITFAQEVVYLTPNYLCHSVQRNKIQYTLKYSTSTLNTRTRPRFLNHSIKPTLN